MAISIAVLQREPDVTAYSVAEAKNTLPKLIDRALQGEEVVITRHGKPVAELVPHRPAKRNARGLLKDELFIIGDIISPIDVEWEALK